MVFSYVVKYIGLHTSCIASQNKASGMYLYNIYTFAPSGPCTIIIIIKRWFVFSPIFSQDTTSTSTSYEWFVAEVAMGQNGDVAMIGGNDSHQAVIKLDTDGNLEWQYEVMHSSPTTCLVICPIFSYIKSKLRWSYKNKQTWWYGYFPQFLGQVACITKCWVSSSSASRPRSHKSP